MHQLINLVCHRSVGDMALNVLRYFLLLDDSENVLSLSEVEDIKIILMV